jgi:hypothetical protein
VDQRPSDAMNSLKSHEIKSVTLLKKCDTM